MCVLMTMIARKLDSVISTMFMQKYAPVHHVQETIGPIHMVCHKNVSLVLFFIIYANDDQFTGNFYQL